MEHLWKGLAIGYAMAAPIGPINLLCLRRSLLEGRRVGFVSGLGAATADATYGAIAAVGLTAVTGFLTLHRSGLQLLVGLFMIALGMQTMRARTPKRREAGEVHVGRLRDAFVSTFVYTLANPLLIMVFAGVFANFDLGWQPGRTSDTLELIGGVFLGSSLWWLTLTMPAGTFRHHLDDGALRWVSRIAGGIIAAIGIWQLLSLLRGWAF